MNPQTVTSVGPYADLWRQLKSFQHALDRALGVHVSRDLSVFDKERLLAIGQFLRDELTLAPATELLTVSSFVVPLSASQQTTFCMDLDVTALVKALPSFKQWLAPQKLGFEKKWQKLASALELYANSLDETLLSSAPPNPEFRILRDIVGELLEGAECALITSSRI